MIDENESITTDWEWAKNRYMPDLTDTSAIGLREALAMCLSTIEDYLDYQHDGDPWSEDARLMGEMDINEFARDGRLDKVRSLVGEQK